MLNKSKSWRNQPLDVTVVGVVGIHVVKVAQENVSLVLNARPYRLSCVVVKKNPILVLNPLVVQGAVMTMRVN